MGQGSAPAGQKPVTLKELFDKIPRQLTANTKVPTKLKTSVDEINDHLRSEVLAHDITMKIRCEEAQEWADERTGAPGFRIKAQDEQISLGGTYFVSRTWFYFPATAGPAVLKVPKGKSVIISGKVTRANFTTMDGLRFNTDVGDAKLEGGN